MQRTDSYSRRNVYGEMRLSLARRGQRPSLWTPVTPWCRNALLPGWVEVMARQMTRGDETLRVGVMYIEFQNMDDAVTAAEVTAFDPDDPYSGVPYYDDLAYSADRDYLRLPLVGREVDTTDPDMFPGGNRANFFAMTDGLFGQHGKPFSDVSYSRIVGGALLAAPDFFDRTRDIGVARAYLPANKQMVKPASSELSMSWRTMLG